MVSLLRCDVAIVGGGILGVTAAYWLSSLYEGRIVVVEKEHQLAAHASRRNTGIIHRPFYLHPKEKRMFARAAQISYPMWRKYALERKLPWCGVGTLEVALEPEQVKMLEEYLKWGRANGMEEDELQLLTREEIASFEPHVTCEAAIYCATDTAVDYRAFTEALRLDAEEAGAIFLTNFKVEGIEAQGGGVRVYAQGRAKPIEARFLLNCAGGNSIDLAHLMGLGREYTDLHFRGEYWVVDSEFGSRIRTNVYSVPKHREMPFLDPHFVVRHDGRREVGPNAVPVAGPESYHALASSPAELLVKLCERPFVNKVRVLLNPEFLSLAIEEWRSSISKRAMASRLKRFIPRLEPQHLKARGTAGIRSVVLDSRGRFVSEAVELINEHSCHVTNYNSPGATGAPAYTAHLIHRLAASGFLDRLKEQKPGQRVWDFHETVSQFDR